MIQKVLLKIYRQFFGYITIFKKKKIKIYKNYI